MRKVIGKKNPKILSPGIMTEQFVFISGQVPTDTNNKVPTDDISEQTEMCLEKMKALLTEAGSSIEKVVKTLVYITDNDDLKAMNKVYDKYFPTEPPARACIRTDLVVHGAKVEIEAIALR